MKEYNPQGGSLPHSLLAQGSLLSSATLGYQEYNPDGVEHTINGYHRTNI